MQFLSAPLLFGLTLAAVPLVIHLLNRRRFQLVEWAPMKYLKLTIRNNRRRMRIEQLLLLLLRTLLIVLLVLVVARPVLSRQGVASWLSRRARVSRIIVLDDSLSMAYRQDGRTALDRGKEAVAELLHVTGAQDAVTVLTTAPASDPLVREVRLEDSSRLLGRLEALKPTDAACDWTATFKRIDDCVSSATFPQRELVLVTDLRRAGWNHGVSDLADRWAAQGVVVKVIDVGSRETADVSLTRFAQEDPIVLPGQVAKLMATIHNGTGTVISGAEAVLSVDGKPRPIILPDLPAGGNIDLPLSVTLDSPGSHILQLSLPDDALAPDNVRYMSLEVREHLDLCIVDGRRSAKPFESAGDFLHVALTAGPDPWRVERLGDADPEASRPADQDVVAMTDVASLSDAAIAAYEQHVRQGMGLMIFLGEQVDSDLYNERLFKKGAGLLPAKLTHIVEGPVRGLVVEGYSDSPLAPLGRIMPAALARIEARRLMGVEIPRQGNDAVRVLARWNDPEGDPAVIEKRFGKGRVLLWTMSADREWSDWPVEPTYVLAVRSAAVAVARADRADVNLVAGRALEFNLPPDRPVGNPRVTVPDDPNPQTLVSDAGRLRYGCTGRAGVYTLAWEDDAAKRQSRQVCVSFDKSASDLQPISAAELTDLLGNLKPDVVTYRPGLFSSAGSGREVWRMLAMALAALFVGESLMASWVGRER
jgi:hypothetical protein